MSILSSLSICVALVFAVTAGKRGVRSVKAHFDVYYRLFNEKGLINYLFA